MDNWFVAEELVREERRLREALAEEQRRRAELLREARLRRELERALSRALRALPREEVRATLARVLGSS